MLLTGCVIGDKIEEQNHAVARGEIPGRMLESVVEHQRLAFAPGARLAADADAAIAFWHAERDMAAQELTLVAGVRLDARAGPQDREAGGAVRRHAARDEPRGQRTAGDVGGDRLAMRKIVQPVHLPALPIKFALE